MRNSVARVLVALILLVVSGTSSIGVAGASPSVTAQAGLVASASGGYDNPEHAYDTVAVSKLVNASLHAGAANLDGIAGNSLLKAVTTLYDSPANFVAPNSIPDPPSVRYDRSAHYGGSQTNGPAAQGLRAAGEGAPCPSCVNPQVTGTKTQPVPEHSPSLLEHYYDHGGHAMTDAQRRAYAQSAEAFDGTMCLTCQRSQGGSLSHLSRWYAQQYGLG